MSPLVTVIVPCFNSGAYLSDALLSIYTQSLGNWECVIVDDGSTDHSKSVAMNFVGMDSRFRYLYQVNSGVSAARNRGLLEARGELIQFMDSDDLMGKNKLMVGVEYLRLNQNIEVAYTGSRYFFSDNPEAKLVYGRNNLIGTIELTEFDDDIIRSFLIRNPFVTSAPIYRRLVFDRVGLYDTGLNYLEDWDFQIRCAIAGIRFHYLGYHPDTAIQVRLREDSLMSDRAEVHKAKQVLFGRYRELRKMHGLEFGRSGRFSRFLSKFLSGLK